MKVTIAIIPIRTNLYEKNEISIVAAKAQEQRGEIQFHILGNSLTHPVTKQSMLWLLGLHSVFAHQLTEMPREYISQLVFDP